MELEDEEGNRISLIEKYDGSVANPAIRRCELMTRIRGFENICNELGYCRRVLYTLTAPSRYHATIKTGHRNRKWKVPARQIRSVTSAACGSASAQSCTVMTFESLAFALPNPTTTQRPLAHADVYASRRCGSGAPENP